MREHGQQNLLTLVIGSAAIALSLYSLITYRHDLTIVAASIYLPLACYTDSRFRKIPNIINASLVFAGLALHFYMAGASGLLLGLAGLALGILLLLLPYLAGGFGAGDVKALAAMGALLGPYPLLHVFAYMALFGGALALLYNLFSKQLWRKFRLGISSVTATVISRDISHLKPANDQEDISFVRFPYATAIAFGYYAYVYWGGIV